MPAGLWWWRGFTTGLVTGFIVVLALIDWYLAR